MESDTTAVSKKALWAGRIVSALPVLFLLMDGIMKLIKTAPVVEATVKLGYPVTTIVPIVIVLLTCTVLYVIPRTSIIVAILLSFYLVVSVATHLRVVYPFFTHLRFRA